MSTPASRCTSRKFDRRGSPRENSASRSSAFTGVHVLCVAAFLSLTPGLAFAQSSPSDHGAVTPTGTSARRQSGSGEDDTAKAAPWRVSTAVGSPKWLQFGATHRLRFEALTNQFRAGVPGDDVGLSLRTTVNAAVQFDPVIIGAELADSRFYFGDDNTPLDTTLVNTFALLRAYAGVRASDILRAGDSGRITAGRMTMDVGSRRLVARNSFRNTINSFDGLDVGWTAPTGDAIQLFAVLPVERRPTSRDALAVNAVEVDRESFDTVFFGASYGSRLFAGGTRFQAYVFGLYEQDGEAPTRDRRLVTPGLRAYRSAARSTLDFDFEGVAQAGSSHSSSAPEDTTELEHLAFLLHGEIGYTFGVIAAPRVLAVYDFGSGDADPNDDRNGRFDTLYGARRFEFGPTGLYGAFTRSNVRSPGLRVEVKPHPRLDCFAMYRPVWLAQKRDAWTTASVRDPSGNSGTFVGNQIEASARFRVLPGNIDVEVGFAHTFLGEFAVSAPNANRTGDPTYGYLQFGLEI